jgi:hypothetical protein
MSAPPQSGWELTTGHRQLSPAARRTPSSVLRRPSSGPRRPAALFFVTCHASLQNAFPASFCLLLPLVFARIPLPAWMKRLWRSCSEVVRVILAGRGTMASPEFENECKRLYAETRTDLLKRQLSNAENYDKAVLSLATGVLGFSLVFIKDIVPFTNAESMWALKVSWSLLFMAILSTLLSFVASQKGIKRQLDYAERYYLKREEEYLNKTNWPARVTNYLNMAAGGFFCVAIIATIWFVSTNMSGGSMMTKSSENNSTPLREGAPIPSMQKVPAGQGERGAPIPELQPVTQPEPAAQPQANPSTDSQGSAGQQSGGDSAETGNP